MSESATRSTALVTGATSGIGFHTAAALAARGHRVLVTGRDEEAGRHAVGELRQRAGHDEVHFTSVDHAAVGENRRLAAWVSSGFDRFDVLVNNVGSGSANRRVTADGYESTLAVNFVGPFALTEALLSLLRRGAPARVVNVISSAFGMWKGDPFEDLHAESRYVLIEAYARAKLLNLLWTLALARRLEGSGVTANAVNPGMAWTSMTQSLTPEAVPAWRYVWPIVRWFQRRRSPETAAQVPAFVASSPEVSEVTGAYFNDKTAPARLKSHLLDVELQERVWALGEHLYAVAPTASPLSSFENRCPATNGGALLDVSGGVTMHDAVFVVEDDNCLWDPRPGMFIEFDSSEPAALSFGGPTRLGSGRKASLDLWTGDPDGRVLDGPGGEQRRMRDRH